MREIRVVCVGYDAHRVYPLRQGSTLAEERFGVRVSLEVHELDALAGVTPAEARAMAEGRDAVLVAALTDDSMAAAARAMAEATGIFLPSAPNTLEIAALARLGGYRLEDPAAQGDLARAAAALAAAGRPVPPFPGVFAQVLPQVAHLLPGELDGLRRLGKILQALLNLSPGNAAIAFAAIAHELDAGQVGDPGWPEVYPACGFWHPLTGIHATWEQFESALGAARPRRGWAGRALLVTFSTQITSGNDAHLRALVEALEDAGIEVIPWFGALDAAGRVDEVQKIPGLDVVINASGFTLTGTHGQPNVTGDVALLSAWGTPQVNAVPLLFQGIGAWQQDRLGLAPVAVAMQVAIPELEAALAPRVYAGRSEADDRMVPLDLQVRRIAAHVARIVRLRRVPNSEKRVAIVLFCVPPDAGSVGTAAYLDVFASLHALLEALQAAGYTVEVPERAEALLDMMLTDGGGGARSDVAMAAWYPAGEYSRTAPVLERVVADWGPPPGDVDTDGANLAIRGLVLGNVAIVVQPDNGGYSDPIGLLYSESASPSHSFVALYDWIRNRFRADAVLHFGTHGALEFMPGKQAGLLPDDFPEALIGDVPHLYYYCMNNPAEAAIARRRSGAEIVSYLSPPVAEAGLYGALEEARDALARIREEGGSTERLGALREAAEAAGLASVVPAELADSAPGEYIERVSRALDELERTLIPLGLHVLGKGIGADEAIGILAAACRYPIPGTAQAPLFDELLTLSGDERATRAAIAALAEGVARGAGDAASLHPLLARLPAERLEAWRRFLAERLGLLDAGRELDGLVAALDGRYIPPAPGGDPVREPDALPSGRGLVAVDPYRVPTPSAVRAGERLAEALVVASRAPEGSLPETIGVVLWGLETIKARGEAIAQVLRLIGVRPRPDSFGRMTDFEVLPLEELGRPRIDVLLTVSGIFRDLFLPAVGLLDRAFRAVACLPESPEENYVRKHAIQLASELGVSIEEAAGRVFSQQAGRYGTGVNDLVLSSAWDDAEALAAAYQHTMSFAYGARTASTAAPRLFAGLLQTVDVTFQNVDSTEVSLSDVDHYFEYLGGLTNAVRAARGVEPTALVADTFHPDGRVRTLAEALWFETKTRLLNPRWRDALLEHGYNGVAQIATRLDNTFGWAATTSAVDERLFEEVATHYLLDAEMREQMARHNPVAVRRMAERLIEAADRRLWQAPDAIRAQLEAVANELDDAIEGVAISAS